MYNRGFLHAPWQGMVGPYNRQLLEWSVENVLLPLHIFFFSSFSLPYFIHLAWIGRIDFIQITPRSSRVV